MKIISKKTIYIILLGGFGGVLFSNILVPWLASLSLFSNVSWIQGLGDKTTIVQRTEEVNIQENEVLKSAIDKIDQSVVLIKAFSNKNFVSQGTGFIVSSDGLILTRREALPGYFDELVIERGNETFSAKVEKRIDDYGLVILKSDSSNLSVVSFATIDENNIGNKVFLLGRKRGEKTYIKTLNTGIVKNVDAAIIETNIKEKTEVASGTPLIDFNGNVLGINFTNAEGYVFAISSKTIQSLIY